MLSNWCFIHLIGNGYNTTTCNEVAHMFKGCETVAVVEQYAREIWAQEMVGMQVSRISGLIPLGHQPDIQR
jgi:hypothetical protein